MNAKPKMKTRLSFDYSMVIEWIEKTYKIQTRDYANSHAHFGEWCDAKGYGKTDQEVNDRGSSQVWFAEFMAEEASGKIKKRPYQDFWHWLCDVANPQRGGTIELDDDYMESATEDWQKKILEIILSEFGKGKNRTVKLFTDW